MREEFFKKNWGILLFLICFGSFVIYSVSKDKKEVGKCQGKDTQKKTDEGKKDANGGLEK